jgi:type I restriction enzyme S subunit
MVEKFKFASLNSLCTQIIDCPHSSPKWTTTGFPVIRNYNIKDGRIDTTKLSYVDEETYISRNKRATPQAGDIVISREAPMGVAAIIPDNFKCCMGQRLVLLKVDRNKCDPQYLLYALMSQFVQAQIKRFDTTGSIVSNLNIKDLGNLIIPLIDNQRAVAQLVKKIDDKIDGNKIISKHLEFIARLVYNYWFVQFDFPDENGRPYRSSGGKMVWNEHLKRDIPEGWTVQSLFDAADVCYGIPLLTKKFSDSGLPVVRIRDILDNSTSAFTCQQVDVKFLTQKGDLLIGMDGNFQMNYWHQTGDCVNQRIVRIREKKIPVMIIRFQVEPHIKAKVDNVARSTVGHLSDKDLKSLHIITPKDMSILKGFDTYINQICLLGAENRQLTALRNFILPLLMNGQVKLK